MKKKRQVVEIPHDVMVEVLARSPAKSLLRCACVCRLWYSTISDPKFAQLHRTYSQTRLGGNYLATLWLYRDQFFVSFKDQEKLRVPLPIELKIKKEQEFRISVSQPLDGLVCIHSQSSYFEDLHSEKYHPHALVLNITTRKILHLPKSRFDYGAFDRKYILGVDPVTGEYKVLNLCNFIGDRPPGCEIYTLGTTSRRIIEDPPRGILRNHSSAPCPCVNGVIYWLAFDSAGSFLIAFEVGKEIFRTIRLSEPVQYSEMLFAIGSQLLATYYFTCDNQSGLLFFEVKDGNQAFVKEKIAFPSTIERTRDLSITGISPTGEIVLVDNTYRRNDQIRSRKVYLDLKKNEWTQIMLRWPQPIKRQHIYDSHWLFKRIRYNHVENIFRWRDHEKVANMEFNFLIDD